MLTREERRRKKRESTTRLTEEEELEAQRIEPAQEDKRLELERRKFKTE